MSSIVSVQNLRKAYAGGFEALKSVNLEIEEGEILALLGPNGAGKTTLISTICGITVATSGAITVGGFDTQTQFRAARSLIGLVPQEINLEPFETVKRTVQFSRGLFGKPKNDALIDQILKDLSLYDKKDNRITTLSGGMKRRVLIAKALSHEPRVLFLDEPTAGVDVELAKGEILLVQNKVDLMAQMGKKQLKIELTKPVETIPAALSSYGLALADDGRALVYEYDTKGERTGITTLLNDLQKAGLQMADMETQQSSLEQIFVDLVKETP